MKKNLLTVITIFLMLVLWVTKCGKSDDEENPYINEPVKSTYESRSSSDESEIVLCPKCNKSYNRATWGEMCNICWSEGRGLKSNGKYIVE